MARAGRLAQGDTARDSRAREVAVSAGPPLPAMRVLVVDDERNIRKTLAVCLQGLGCQVTECASTASALEALARASCDLAFVDLRLGREDGMDLVPALLAERPGLDIIIVTAYATFETAAEAIKRGARD